MFMANNRNTNYFGECLLYLSFAVLVGNIEGYIILLLVWGSVFVARIYAKDKSLKKKEGWSRYSENSYIFLFKFFSVDLLNYLLYSFIVFAIYRIIILGGIENIFINKK